MAKSFSQATPENVVEDFSRSRGHHPESKRHYQMVHEDGRYMFRRYQVDENGERINIYEKEVDWILGSGHTARTYLYQTQAGELYQLPIAYYAQEKMWYMAPGYDRREHHGVTRSIGRDCMFCHNAYPDVPQGTDIYSAPQVFPSDLPQGIGCQRCHGPGAEHVRAAQAEGAMADVIRAKIVNPGRLERQLRDDVCNQCHMQPSAAFFGVRRFGKSDYSYRPGQPLADYLVHLDVVEQGMGDGDRFESNHHSYRLRQSRCFQVSAGQLSCLTCHDPHRKVSEADRAAHYRAACLTCHEPDQIQQAHATANPAVRADDCTSCHMPRRRTQDVVHAVATDHLIRRQRGGEELLAPLEEIDHTVTEVKFLDPDKIPEDPVGGIYRAAAIVRVSGGSHAPAVDRLQELLTKAGLEEVEPYLDLAKGQIRQRRFRQALETLKGIIERDPENLQARDWLGLVLIGLSQLDQAQEQLLQVLRDDATRPETHYNLGLVLLGKDEDETALGHFEQAVKLRPNMAPAWFYLGRANANLNRLDEAIVCFKRTLSIEPSHTRAYVQIGEALIAKGNRDEAIRYYQHGLNVASRLAPIAEALDRAKSTQN